MRRTILWRPELLKLERLTIPSERFWLLACMFKGNFFFPCRVTALVLYCGKGSHFGNVLKAFFDLSFSSVTQLCLTLRSHGLQPARPPCPSPTTGAYTNSCPLSQWCHPTISSSVVPFSSCLQSFPASWSFQMSQFFASGDQSIGVSASSSVLPMNIQDWFPLGWTAWISLQSKGLKSSPTPQFKSINSSTLKFSLQSNSHIHTWLLEKS